MQILLRSWKTVAIFLIPILIPNLTCCLYQRSLWNVQNSLVTLKDLCCFWGNRSRGAVLGPVGTQQHWSVRSWPSLLGQFEVFVEGKGILPRTRFSHKETSSAAKDPPQHTQSSKVMKKRTRWTMFSLVSFRHTIKGPTSPLLRSWGDKARW